MSTEEDEPVRATILIRPSLKKAIKSVTGSSRGMSPFIIAAIHEKLDGNPHDIPSEPNMVNPDNGDVARQAVRDMHEARYVAQTLADALAQMDGEEPRMILKEMNLPPWVVTADWPGFEPVATETEPEPEPEEEVPETERQFSELLTSRGSGESNSDFLNKIMSKAQELGINRASDIPQPEPKAPPEPEPAPANRVIDETEDVGF